MVCIFLKQGLNFLVAYLLQHLHQIADAISVYRPSEFNLRFNLVAVRNSYFTHVVTEARHLETAAFCKSHCSSRPACNVASYLGVLPMSNDDFTRDTEPCPNMTILAVTMSGLVRIHEIHIDRFPRNVTIKLRVEMQKRLL
ncbi:hypothetical protein D3C78_1280120 [compost metagenome]